MLNCPYCKTEIPKGSDPRKRYCNRNCINGSRRRNGKRYTDGNGAAAVGIERAFIEQEAGERDKLVGRCAQMLLDGYFEVDALARFGKNVVRLAWERMERAGQRQGQRAKENFAETYGGSPYLNGAIAIGRRMGGISL